jgi:glyoxylase-like metal-dependent hydrolase (beta-lactamase superfamily II)/8-oxo-dGTP pyrophosphatase MutT (NUDIX family)
VSGITQAASVLLARGPKAAEVFVVRRSEALRFFGGFHAFPGGKVVPEDNEVPLWTNGSPGRDARIACAARELFEETGVLLARRDGAFPDPGPWEEERRRLLADTVRFGDFLLAHGLRLHAEDFRLAGSLVTPAFAPVRFDTAFYVAMLPPGQQSDVWPGELAAGFWTSADDELARWTRGECLVSPPTLSLLELLRSRSAMDLPALLAPVVRALEAGALPPIYFAPGVQMIPLQTIGLPSSTYTNAYLVGSTRLYLLDPGAHEPREQERLFDVLNARLSEGGILEAVVLTHHHPDHVNAAAAVVSRYRVPVFAHPRTMELLKGRVQVDRFLEEGDHLDLGTAPDGSGGWHLEATFTPGHAGGHLVFYEPHYRLLFAGDMVSMLSSVVIAPPDGDLGLYLASLRRLRDFDCRLLLPGHGAPTARPRQVIDDALAHRAKREDQLLAALREGGPLRVADLAGRLYRDLAAELLPLAALQVWAGLEKLQREGKTVRVDSGEAEEVEDRQRWAAV